MSLHLCMMDCFSRNFFTSPLSFLHLMTVRLADVGLAVDTECIGEDPSTITLAVIILTNIQGNFIIGASNVGALRSVGQTRACINKDKSEHKGKLHDIVQLWESNSVPGDDEAVATIRPVEGKAPDVGPDTKLKSE